MRNLEIIIPAKNEEHNVLELIERIDRSLTKDKISYRIIFVDDNSTDGTESIVRELSSKYPINYIRKSKNPGKAYSIIQGAKFAQSTYVVMIDADLQYPPELINSLYKKAREDRDLGVVIANRTTYKSSPWRRFISRANSFVFGKLLFGFKTDIQSGLKLFRREIVEHIDTTLVYPWSIDIPLLYTCRELGFTIGAVEGTFEVRGSGISKINVVGASVQIAWGAIRQKLASRRVYPLKPVEGKNMREAGIVYKRKKYITHSTLHHGQSAFQVLTNWQKFGLAFIAGLIVYGVLVDIKSTAIGVVAVLSFIYFIDVVFNLFLILKSLHFPPEVKCSVKELEDLDESKLPVYSILCPLYREAHVIPQFVESLNKLDYPKEKLEVLLLLEEDDAESLDMTREMNLPGYIRTLVVPQTLPKTKPKACNWGLSHARGEYVVIYDAEDIVEPKQLKKAVAAFNKMPRNVACLQAKLNFYNPHHNLLTRFFTAEYSLWFDVVLPGLQSIETAIPLGGTSNHFRLEDLKKLQGWDAFNVTEDCDLGTRLFKAGMRTAIIDSITLEEANSRLGNWLRQRSRWIKGYIQTYLVHTRNPVSFIRKYGLHAFIFHLVVGGKIAFMVINPILWAMTIAYFTLYSFAGPTIEALYPAVVFYMAVASLVFGNFLFLYYYMIGCAKRGHWTLIKWVYLVPFYWLGVSVAALIAFGQLITRPHYWEKTHHGFHLKNKKNLLIAAPEVYRQEFLITVKPKSKFSGLIAGGVFLSASMIANLVNFANNAYLGRELAVVDFGMVSLMTNIYYLVFIPFGALAATITYRSGYLKGRYGKTLGALWMQILNRAFSLMLVAAGVWLIATPFLMSYFNTDNVLPFIVFAPVWVVGVAASVNGGFLSGNLAFGRLAIVIIIEAVVKLLTSVVAVYAGIYEFVYIALPVSLTASFLVGYALIKNDKKIDFQSISREILKLPKAFFSTALLTRVSTISFLSLDLILAKHYLTELGAGYYSLLSLVGKMVFFFTSLFTQLVIPYVANSEGEKKNSEKIFGYIFLATAVFGAVSLGGVGILGQITLPILLGEKILPVLPQIPLYTTAMVLFSLSQTVVSYYQAKKKYLLSYLSILVTTAQAAGVGFFHENVADIVEVMLVVSACYLTIALLYHLLNKQIARVHTHIADFLGLIFWEKNFSSAQSVGRANLRILIFNWRDERHVWAGGAESYVHQLAKEWVLQGNRVTVFCGNDGKSPRNQEIEGVQIVRRGGFYTVYIWAFLYYVFAFRGKFDVVIDSENGIPFFTPIYVGVPKILLIHHIHQEVFRRHLNPLLGQIAIFLESGLMPYLYRKVKVVTVSESSREEIVKLKRWEKYKIELVNPGKHLSRIRHSIKTSYPSFVYLGRLKPYKNIDVLISAFAQVAAEKPKARLTIAGEGESLKYLKGYSKELGIAGSVDFIGRVSEEQKVNEMARAWVFVHPSMIEGWGITVVEANACGTPVVASNVAGLKDSVIHNKTGILVPPGNVASLAANMKVLITNTAYRVRLSREAYRWSKNFSWEKSAGEFLHIIHKILNEQKINISGEVALEETKI